MNRSFSTALLRTIPLLLLAAGCAPDRKPAFDHRGLQASLDAVVPPALEAGHVCGAVILVGLKTSHGYDTWSKAYGYRQTQPDAVPMTPDTIFDLASMTKPIATGTAVMILADRGELSIDDPVGRYLPEFNTGDKANVTIRHLMTHMSGMKPYVHAGEQKQLRAANGFPCRAALRRYIRELPLARPPGEAVVYSCLNAILCAEIVRTVSGQEIDAFTAENAFRPLGLVDTGFNPPPSLWPRIAPTTPTDYGRGPGGFLLGQVHDPLAAMQDGLSGNAGLFTTAADLSRFAQMMLNGGELDGVRVLQPETVTAMTTVQNPGAVNAKGVPDRRGLLWDIYYPAPDAQGIDAVYAYGHTGYTGTAIRIYPEKGLYVIALANRVHPDDGGKVESFRRNVWETVGRVVLRLGAAPAAQTSSGKVVSTSVRTVN